jgi:hypothetical protein
MSAVTLALNNTSYGKFQCAKVTFWSEDVSTKTRNEYYANFLASGQIGQPKRGFTVQKPTDLSRYTDDGLVAAYNMTLDEDGTVSDLSGNGNDGTNYGGIPDDKGIYFNGASYIDLGSAFQSTMRGDFSFVIRFKPDDGQPATDNTLIGCLNASTEDWFYIQSKSTGALRNYYEANNDPLSNYTDVFLADGQEQWYTVVFSVQKKHF